MAKLNKIKVSIPEKNEIKKDSPDTLPLNPTAQGFSGAEVRRRLSKSITGEEGSVLSLLVDKMNIISDLFYIILDESDDDSIIEQLKKKLPKDGTEPMEGTLNMDGNDIEAIASIIFGESVYLTSFDDNHFTINLKNGETYTFSENGLNMFLRKLTGVAKGVNSKDGANMENINDIESAVKELDAQVALKVNKSDLRGYNLAMPDLTGKEYLGGSVYRVYDSSGITIDYDIYSGIWTINGTSTDPILYTVNNIDTNAEYTLSYIAVSGTMTSSSYLTFFISTPILTILDQVNQNVNKQNTFTTTTQDILRLNTNNSTFNNYQFKLQLEKGDTATPYTVSGQIPQYKIVGEKDDDKLDGDKLDKIYPKDTTFMVVSTNLANVDDRIEQSSIDISTGEPTFNVGNDLTQFIPIKPNTQYTIANSSRKGFYGINKEFISTNTDNGIFTSPPNAYFIRIVVSPCVGVSNLQLNEGGTLLPYEKHYSYFKNNSIRLDDGQISTNKVDFIFESSNIFDKKQTQYGKIVTISGVVEENLGYYLSDYIQVEIGKTYFLKNVTSFALYDYNKKFIIRLNTEYISNTFNNTNAYYIRLNVERVLIDGAYVNYDDDKGYSEYYLQTKSLKLNNILNNFSMPIDFPNELLKTPDGVYDDFNTPLDLYSAYEALVSNYSDYLSWDLKGKDASDTYNIYELTLKPKEISNNYLSNPIPKILITTGVHGSEKTSIFATYYFVKALCESWETNEVLEHLRFNYEIKIITLANPYVFVNGGRTNYNGVDLNRNQPYAWQMSSGETYGGTAPLSEPESVIINDFIKENLDSIMFVDFHTNGSSGNDWDKCMYVDMGGGELNNEMINEVNNYWVKTMSRMLIKDFSLIPDTDFLGFVYREPSQGKVAEEASYLGLNSATIECWSKFPSEENFYSSNTIKGSTEVLGNYIMMLIRRLVHQYKG